MTSSALPVWVRFAIPVIAIGFWFSFSRGCKQSDPSIPARVERFSDASEALGIAVAETLSAGDAIMVVQLPDPMGGDHPIPKAQLRGLEKALKGRDITMVTPVTSPALQEEWPRAMATSQFRPELAKALLDAAPQPVAGIVSFIGLPEVHPSDLGSDLPLFFALGNQNDRGKNSWLRSGKARILIVPKITPSGSDFESRYDVLTP